MELQLPGIWLLPRDARLYPTAPGPLGMDPRVSAPCETQSGRQRSSGSLRNGGSECCLPASCLLPGINYASALHKVFMRACRSATAGRVPAKGKWLLGDCGCSARVAPGMLWALSFQERFIFFCLREWGVRNEAFWCTGCSQDPKKGRWGGACAGCGPLCRGCQPHGAAGVGGGQDPSYHGDPNFDG